MAERIVIVSDTQIPYDDRRAVQGVIDFIGATAPDRVVHIGDLMDYPTPSRWTKGTAEEFAQRIKPDSEQAKRRFLSPLRAVYDGPVLIHKGNHDVRPVEYLHKYAPALIEFAEQFELENLLDFDSFGVEVAPEFYKIAPGWISTHGHRGGIRTTQKAADSAFNAMQRFGTSVVIGHTHRQGIKPHTTGFGGKQRVLWSMEVGNLMNMKLAQYLKGATANWQSGFAMLTVDGNHVKPELIPIVGGRFSVDGHVWEV
ncbi:phosphoesterase [Mycobacterium phage Sham4]|uniref:metallo-phosphoesterase n=1 Tax=Mycobacterium phage Mulciber TaxID=1805459 RepID=UPI00078B9023|nr:metallo-phosphoesterase [Mycobacterium phage Mulciber]AQT28188.1 metallophosphoesterase [Mycobacterium phage Jabith]ASR86692.1 phosphoesterase [Mycobacterium phage Et2Brutus]AXC33515.1 metallophosphoesterase [Mycobacterium phage Joselito]AXH50735.1 metallophosphoesterase [Mycobacterium phage Snape]QBI97886.1 metallophosphoesterase [Mycobacterium phage Orange]QBI98227.1 metallophosphoesterase [Mycobacterium phage Bowtie]QBI98426.1 metallophosphoesterase [Mycobacterium phage Munch]QBI98520